MTVKKHKKQTKQEAIQMTEIKKISRKHIGKKVSDEQDMIIGKIKANRGLKTYLEAKHIYFENQKRYDENKPFRNSQNR